MTRFGWAEAIEALALGAHRGTVSVTPSYAQGDPSGADGPRWVLSAVSYGPQGGRRGDVQLVLTPEARAALLGQLVADRAPVAGRPATPLVIPEPDGYDPDTDDPRWTVDGDTITATPAGVEIEGELEQDADLLERIALAMLAALTAHRAMKEQT